MEEDKDFSRWCGEYGRKSESLKLMYQLKGMYERNEMCDFIIKSSDGKEFHVHKLIICASIPYFRSLKDFCDVYSENKDAVTLDMFSSETIELIINYIYNGKIEFHKDTVSDVVNAADYLKIESLKNEAMEKMFDFGDKNILFHEKVVLCIESSITKYKEAQKFYGENFLEFSEKESFYLLGIESLISILDKEYLSVPNEEFVFNSAMKWMYHDYQNRKQYILDIFSILRIAYLDNSFIFDKILTEPTIINNVDCRDKISKYFKICLEELSGSKYLRKFSIERNSYQLKCLIYNDSFNNDLIHIEEKNFIQSSGEWSPPSHVFFEKTDHVLGIKYNNKIYFFQYLDLKNYGSGVILDMDNRSTKRVSFSNSRSGRVMEQSNDKIFSIGGRGSIFESADLVECYSFRNDNVTALEPIPNGIINAASVIFNNNIYIIGGVLDYGAIPNVKKYSIYKNVWEEIHPINNARCNASAIVYNNRIFVVGGNGLTGNLNSCEVYDIEQGIWSNIPDMPYKRARASLSIKKDFLYVVGGVGEEPNRIMKYNLLQSTWHEGPLLDDLKLRYVPL
uniref:BTB domain-containing protein n=1 Tax=Strongyloides stercoralis TaxID=6248 RepID=A0A0K0E1J3_STRER